MKTTNGIAACSKDWRGHEISDEGTGSRHSRFRGIVRPSRHSVRRHGGLAVRVYGIPRATYDVDFTAAIPRERLSAIYAAAADHGYTVADAYLSGWIDQVAGMPLVKFRMYGAANQGIDIDVFIAETQFQTHLLARRRRALLEDLNVWLVSPEDLILLKLLAGRQRDLADVGDILFIQGQLDEAHLRRWPVFSESLKC